MTNDTLPRNFTNYYGQDDIMRKMTVQDLRDSRRPVLSFTVRHLVDAYKLSNGCLDCGYSASARALQFDHRLSVDKYRTATGTAVHLSDMVKSGREGRPRYAWVTILAEIDKCDVRCANCHAVRSHLQAVERDMALGIDRLRDRGVNWD